VNEKGGKVYWEEIESIYLSKTRGWNMTAIHIQPHCQQEVTNRIKRKRAMWVTTAYGIPWIAITHAKEFNDELIKEWERRKATNI